MHAATAFETLQLPGANFLEGVTKLRQIEVRVARGGGMVAWCGSHRCTRAGGCLGQMRHLVVSMILATDNAVHGQVLTEYTDRLQRIGEEPLRFKDSEKDCTTVFGVMLHCADVSNVREWSPTWWLARHLHDLTSLLLLPACQAAPSLPQVDRPDCGRVLCPGRLGLESTLQLEAVT